MGRTGIIPFALRARVLGKRASLIQDPVARLRYLRQNASPGQTTRRAVLRATPVAVAVGAVFAGVGVATAPVVPAGPGRSSPARPPAAARIPDVWLVTSTADREIYSNGLHIETGRTVHSETRSEPPRGIVFHTSESQIASWTPESNARLKKLSKGLIDWVCRERAYHYLVDRVGLVHRVVAEEDVAYHAGHSIWADDERTYVGLNGLFLAVSFESRTRSGDEDPEITPAQIRAARVLVEMLRSRHGIRDVNCVTHAQVSVNPANGRIGWHTDWAANFPFEAIGLPDNYALPVAAIEKFGFTCDPAFFAATGARMWRGVIAAEDTLRARALEAGVSVAAFKSRLRKSYQFEIEERRSEP